MQHVLSHPQAASSVLAALKAWLMGPIDRIARAADVAGVLGRRRGAAGKGRVSRHGRAARQSRAPLPAALWELAEILASWRPSRIRSCLRQLNQLT